MATTRLGQIGIGVDAYGVFQPKGDAIRGQLTRFGIFGIMSARYRVFVPKALAGASTRDNFFLVM
jgi:hypothetical protein